MAVIFCISGASYTPLLTMPALILSYLPKLAPVTLPLGNTCSCISSTICRVKPASAPSFLSCVYSLLSSFRWVSVAASANSLRTKAGRFFDLAYRLSVLRPSVLFSVLPLFSACLPLAFASATASFSTASAFLVPLFSTACASFCCSFAAAYFSNVFLVSGRFCK